MENSVRRAKQIQLPKVLFTTHQNYDIWTIFGRHLRLPVDVIDVEIKLTKLLLYEAGDHYKEIVVDSKPCGIFTVWHSICILIVTFSFSFKELLEW